MANEEHPVYCPRCGSIVQAGDRFCGVCGAGVPPDAQEVTPTQEIPTQVPPPPSIPSRRRNQKLINGVMVGVLLLLLLIGAGAMALANFGSGSGLLGGTREDPTPSGPSDPAGGTSEPPSSHGATPNASTTGEKTVDLSNDTSPPAEPTGSTESTSSTSPPGSNDELSKAVEDYYEAVDREDWAYTYDHLDSETRSVFTRGEWYKKNQWYAEHYPLDLESIDVHLNGSATDRLVSVTVYRTFKDGTSLGRDTFFVFENGEWKHRFGQEENKLYMPDASYEEFVKAQ